MAQLPESRPRVLIFSQWFTPAIKAGGPIRSIQNFVDNFSGEMELFLFTGDRDLGDKTPFNDIVNEVWHSGPGYKIYYSSKSSVTGQKIRDILTYCNPDVVYLNSMYGWHFSLLPIWILKRMHWKGRVVLAPRGMLKSTALQFKSTKKKVFLTFARIIGLFSHLVFHATDQTEKDDIQQQLGILPRQIYLLSNLPVRPTSLIQIGKKPGLISLLFVGRIHPIKGLSFLLQQLSEVKGDIELHIVGWVEDRGYKSSCDLIIARLPSTTKVVFHNEYSFEKLSTLYESTHALILPTRGENFGHAIFESMAHGRPVLISDQTPWKDLEEKKAGWIVPLNDTQKFRRDLQRLVNMDEDAYSMHCQAAYAYAVGFSDQGDLKKGYRELFQKQKQIL